MNGYSALKFLPGDVRSFAHSFQSLWICLYRPSCSNLKIIPSIYFLVSNLTANLTLLSIFLRLYLGSHRCAHIRAHTKIADLSLNALSYLMSLFLFCSLHVVVSFRNEFDAQPYSTAVKLRSALRVFKMHKTCTFK